MPEIKKKKDEEKTPGQINTNVSFNPDKSVAVNNQTLTPEQYKAFNEAGTATAEAGRTIQSYDPAVNALIVKQQQERARIADPIGYITALQLDNKINNTRAIEKPALLPFNEFAQASAQVSDTPLQEFGKEFSKAATAEPKGGLGGLGAAAKVVGVAGVGMGRVYLDLYKNIKAIVTTSDIPKVKDARATFKQANDEAAAEIKLVREGKDPSVALSSIKTAIMQNADMGAAAKRKGLYNLKYWLAGGKDLEVEVALNQQELERQYEELLAAIEIGKINQMQNSAILEQNKAKFGL